MKAAAKVRKLVRDPGVFFRDYLLKRHPLSIKADINRPRKHDARSSTERPSKAAKVETLLEGFIDPSFAVDVVYTWVNLDDADFRSEKQKYVTWNGNCKPEAVHDARFKSRDELRFSIRSIHEYAPWVRRIFIATNGQVPSWFNADNDKVTIVRHEEFIPKEHLPTFNSHVIESCLHRIPGLSKHYIYFNDDVFLLRPSRPTDFFTETGLMRGFLSRAVVPNSPAIPTDTPSTWAIKNARSLLFSATGHYISAKFAHTYHPQRRDVAEDAERLFPDAFDACRQNKFRQQSDILCTSWLNPCLSYITGRGVFSRTRAWYFGIRDRSAIPLYSSLLQMKNDRRCPYSVCLNDHVNPCRVSDFDDYEEYLRDFLSRYFPNKAPCEADEVSSSNLDVCWTQLSLETVG